MPKTYSFGTRTSQFASGSKVEITFGKRNGTKAECIGWSLRKNRWKIKLTDGEDAGKEVFYPEKKMKLVGLEEGHGSYARRTGNTSKAEVLGSGMSDGLKEVSAVIAEKMGAEQDIRAEFAEKGKALLAEAHGEEDNATAPPAPPADPEEIPEPKGLKDGDSYDARKKTYRKGKKIKTVITYTITHEDRSYTEKVVTTDYDGKKKTMNKHFPAPAGAEDEDDEVPPPPDLPSGAGYEVEEERFERSDGATKFVRTYTVILRGNGGSYKHIVTTDFDGTVTSVKP